MTFLRSNLTLYYILFNLMNKIYNFFIPRQFPPTSNTDRNIMESYTNMSLYVK